VDAGGGQPAAGERLMRPEVRVAALDVLIERLSNDVIAEAARAYAARGRFAMAIPGGSVVPALKAVTLDWKRTHIFWVDERAVPPSSPDSNFRLAHEVWLGPAQADASAIHRMPADGPDLQAAAHDYSLEITRTLGQTPRFDLVLLGVGPDGHVASLFPGRREAAAEEEALVLPIVDSPKPPPRRLTLTMRLLTSARRVIVMALGESKRAVMQEALTREESSLPVSLVLKRAKRALVLLDQDAARL
jgi:6-phosphogluconolactonase